MAWSGYLFFESHSVYKPRALAGAPRDGVRALHEGRGCRQDGSQAPWNDRLDITTRLFVVDGSLCSSVLNDRSTVFPSCFLTLLPPIRVIEPVNFHPSDRQAVVSSCGFNLYFSSYEWGWTSEVSQPFLLLTACCYPVFICLFLLFVLSHWFKLSGGMKSLSARLAIPTLLAFMFLKNWDNYL